LHKLQHSPDDQSRRHKKVKIEEYPNGIGAAPYSARNCEPHETGQHNFRPEKHELQQNSVGQTHTNAGNKWRFLRRGMHHITKNG
jgi:hypothetical protein